VWQRFQTRFTLGRVKGSDRGLARSNRLSTHLAAPDVDHGIGPETDGEEFGEAPGIWPLGPLTQKCDFRIPIG